MDVIVGTAGHIDHGKTALVKALTGIDADRLPEEKQRGITIDLGFAELQAGETKFGFVDVPGHERFVKNMLAGASGMDLVMLVVAADEGVMPQTREHFDICRLLKIDNGIVVLTKADLADEETLELAKLDVAELVEGSFLETAPLFIASAKTGTGIEELKDGLVRAAESVRRAADIYETRLPIDRSFSVKGFGAVVTGTLASGEIDEGDELALMPAGRRLRVRGVQTHGRTVKRAHPGQRTAVNLAGIDHDEIVRGMVLARPESLVTSSVFDAEVEVLADSPRSLKSRHRVRVHLGTSEVLARVAVMNDAQSIEPGSMGFAQFRLEAPVVAAQGDRFIIRSYSPQHTIAGGRVLDPLAHRHRRSELDKTLGSLSDLAAAGEGGGNPAEIFVRMAGEKGMTAAELRSRTGLRSPVILRIVESATENGTIIDAAGVLVSKPVFESLEAATLAVIEKHHAVDKLSRGVQRETLRERVFKHSRPEVFRAVTDRLERSGKVASDQDVVRLAKHETKLSPTETAVHNKLQEIYRAAALEVPKLEDALAKASDGSGLDQKNVRKLFQLLVNGGELVAVTNEYYFTASSLTDLVAKVRDSGARIIDVATFKEIAGVSRKYAIPLLEYFDRTRVTRRVGDKRELL